MEPERGDHRDERRAHDAHHAPWEKDNRFYQKYIDAGLKPFEATLASMIEGMDKSLGDVMETLKRLHVDQSTILLFVSDNGSPSQCPPNLPLRGHKITPYEGGIRVPMLAKWPGVTKPKSVNTNPVVVEDFFPTILELAGVAKPKTLQHVDGKSFVPLLKGGGETPTERAFVWHFPHQYSGTPFSAIRQGPWKLIYHHITRKRELFHLDDDIGETTDLAATHPEKVAKSVDVYLLGGQSNMQGIGRIADLPADVPRTIPHTFFWTGQKFEPLVLGTTKISTRLTDFGPEVGFALGTATASHPVYLIKYHASGMPLHHGWHGDQWVGGDPTPQRRNFYPGERPDDTNTGTLYTEMRKQFQSGLQHLREQELTPRVCGFVWMQGEQDAKHQDSATAYAASLRRLRLHFGKARGDEEHDPDFHGWFLSDARHRPLRRSRTARPR